ncbi:MAG: hypothetical protein AB7I27_11145 [Bacteriovoracaceae bacterium]
MKYILILLLSFTNFSFASIQEFPTSPDPRLTPGSLCTHPDTYRYPERIPYCKRDVDTPQKQAVFELYRKKLGYTLNPNDRESYKIDHYFPLCAGGSNDMNNLWPQHKSVYRKTDQVENYGCDKLSKGRISQKDLITLIIKMKADPSIAPGVLEYLKKL